MKFLMGKGGGRKEAVFGELGGGGQTTGVWWATDRELKDT